MDYMSTDYQTLRALIKRHFKYTMIAYPGSAQPRLKIINAEGLTVLYASFDVVIKFAFDLLDHEGIEHNIGDNDDDE